RNPRPRPRRRVSEGAHSVALRGWEEVRGPDRVRGTREAARVASRTVGGANARPRTVFDGERLEPRRCPGRRRPPGGGGRTGDGDRGERDAGEVRRRLLGGALRGANPRETPPSGQQPRERRGVPVRRVDLPGRGTGP